MRLGKTLPTNGSLHTGGRQKKAILHEMALICVHLHVGMLPVHANPGPRGRSVPEGVCFGGPIIRAMPFGNPCVSKLWLATVRI